MRLNSNNLPTHKIMTSLNSVNARNCGVEMLCDEVMADFSLFRRLVKESENLSDSDEEDDFDSYFPAETYSSSRTFQSEREGTDSTLVPDITAVNMYIFPTPLTEGGRGQSFWDVEIEFLEEKKVILPRKDCECKWYEAKLSPAIFRISTLFQRSYLLCSAIYIITGSVNTQIIYLFFDECYAVAYNYFHYARKNNLLLKYVPSSDEGDDLLLSRLSMLGKAGEYRQKLRYLIEHL